MTISFTPGHSHPIGATVSSEGVNFSVYANQAAVIELLLFTSADDWHPAEVIQLDPREHRSGPYWHIFIHGVKSGQIYAYRAYGPNAPESGLCFNPDKILLDPYGRGIAIPALHNRDAIGLPGDNTAAAMKSVVVDNSVYDWEGDQPLLRPIHETVIYEMHVAGFTRHPSSGVAPESQGTYAGVVEKIPYLQELGITAVELLPVFQFDQWAAPNGMSNYWGYQPISFFAPHADYSSRPDPLGVLDEFRDMVKALHRAGIEVILDVVYNHTAEGFSGGATFSFRGLANDVYYILEPADKSRYADFTGCGNTLNAGDAVVRRLISDSLRYWVQEMHVDGFRFDLASVLTRGENGEPLPNPPIIWDIDSDPILSGTKLIAEAWDAAGLYQVGSFVGDSWLEWNGRFRDDVRRFIKGDNDTVPTLARRLIGSPDLYAKDAREPEQSINFITVHDGFTLNDLVTYNGKHNEANGEDNRDGSNDNLSWNCGIEGPTDDPAIEALRKRQIKNFFTLLLTAVGMPLIQMGDEVRRTQGGNNNAYCQDNELSWFDWTLVDKHADIHRFVKQLITDRRYYGRGRTEEDVLNQLLQKVKIEFHGVKLATPDTGSTSHTLAMSRLSSNGKEVFHAMANAYWQPLDFELPAVPSGTDCWRLWIDTYLPSCCDIYPQDTMPPVVGSSYRVGPRSIVALVARQ